ALSKMGHRVNHSVYAYDRSSGRVHAILIDPETGEKRAGADRRREAFALAY
ncbi:MAG: hypothetical protein HYY94_03910, partial [Gemmatimonadetes bacterium]|nr:hypothetical protein [Gemmatimonadota bacterium]